MTDADFTEVLESDCRPMKNEECLRSPRRIVCLRCTQCRECNDRADIIMVEEPQEPCSEERLIAVAIRERLQRHMDPPGLPKQKGLEAKSPGNELFTSDNRRSASQIKLRAGHMNDLLTVSETAAYLRLSKAQTYKLITEKKIPHIRLGQKRLVIRRTELEKWLEGNSQRALE